MQHQSFIIIIERVRILSYVQLKDNLVEAMDEKMVTLRKK